MITTRSQFFYGIEIDENSNKLDFYDTEDLTAEITVGFYSLEDFAEAVAYALTQSAVGVSFTSSVDRTTRKITLVGDDVFSIITDGDNAGLSAWGIAGFTSNGSGASTYESNTAVGSVYRPQIPLQDYVPFENYIESIEGSVKQSTSGEVEVVSFGEARYMECKINFITANEQQWGAYIENQPNGLANALDFLGYLVKKGRLEFMPDRNTPDTYYRCILESTPLNKSGIGFRLNEMRIQGYYDTGKLRFREV